MRRTRFPASDAILDLREALGVTQPEFAQIFGSGRSSVARWETSDPPHGITLLELSKLARERAAFYKDPKTAQKFFDIAANFRRIYLEEVFATLDIFGVPR